MKKKTKREFGSSQKFIDSSILGHIGFGIICPFLINNKSNTTTYIYNFVLFLFLHTIMELLENTHVGIMFWKCNGHQYYYGDSLVNVFGDSFGFIVGWIIGYFISINVLIPNNFKTILIIIVIISIIGFFFGNISDSSKGMYKFVEYLYKCKLKKICTVKDCKYYNSPTKGNGLQMSRKAWTKTKNLLSKLTNQRSQE